MLMLNKLHRSIRKLPLTSPMKETIPPPHISGQKFPNGMLSNVNKLNMFRAIKLTIATNAAFLCFCTPELLLEIAKPMRATTNSIEFTCSRKSHFLNRQIPVAKIQIAQNSLISTGHPMRPRLWRQRRRRPWLCPALARLWPNLAMPGSSSHAPIDRRRIPFGHALLWSRITSIRSKPFELPLGARPEGQICAECFTTVFSLFICSDF